MSRMFEIVLPILLFYILTVMQLMKRFMHHRFFQEQELHGESRAEYFRPSLYPSATEMALASITLDIASGFPGHHYSPGFSSGLSTSTTLLSLFLLILHVQCYFFGYYVEHRASIQGEQRRADYLSMTIGLTALITNGFTVSTVVRGFSGF